MKKIKITKEVLYNLYIVEKQSLNQVALELGIGQTTVSRKLKLYKISARKSGGSFRKGLKLSEETRKKMSEGTKKSYAENPEYRKIVGDRTRERYLNPKYKEKMSKISREIQNRKEYREMRSSITKKNWKNPEYRKKATEAIRKAVWKGGAKAAWARHDCKRRRLGFNPLNEPFEKCEAHHINFNDVIYIPKELHRSISHCLETGKNMALINKLAYQFLFDNYIIYG